MAPGLVYESDAQPPETSYVRELCYEEGDRIIALDEVLEHHLVLNSEIFDRASLFFSASGKNDWGKVATTIRHQPTGKDRKVLTYYLVLNKETGTITLNKTRPSGAESLDFFLNEQDYSVSVFYLSRDAHGFTTRRHHQSHFRDWSCYEGRRIDTSLEYLSKIRINHKVMFKLLYKEYVYEMLEYEDIADIAAYAELYDLLAEIAPRLRQLLLEMSDIWTDVKKNYHFHIALARKLECEEIFTDAFRHYIGSGSPLSDLTTRLGFDAEYAFRAACIRENQKKQIETLLQHVQALGLPTHIPDTAPMYAAVGPGKPVKTAFFSSAVVPTHLNRVQQIAHNILLQWLAHQQLGEKHYAHVRDNPDYDAEEVASWNIDTDSDDEDDRVRPRDSTHGVHLPSSFRNACNYAIEASQTGKELEIFDENVAEAFIRKSSLGASPYTTLEVQSELKKLINQMANLALPMVAPREYKLVKADKHKTRYGDPLFGMNRPESYYPYDAELRNAQNRKTYATRGGRGRGRGFGRGFGRGYVEPAQIPRGPGTIPPGTFGFAHTYINEPDQPLTSGPWGTSAVYNETEGGRYGMTAHDDSNIHYFTATEIWAKDMPWDCDDVLGKEYEICDLQPASAEWLKALGVLKEDEDVEEGENAGAAS